MTTPTPPTPRPEDLPDEIWITEGWMQRRPQDRPWLEEPTEFPGWHKYTRAEATRTVGDFTTEDYLTAHVSNLERELSFAELSGECIMQCREIFKKVDIQAAFFDDCVGEACRQIAMLREENAALKSTPAARQTDAGKVDLPSLRKRVNWEPPTDAGRGAVEWVNGCAYGWNECLDYIGAAQAILNRITTPSTGAVEALEKSERDMEQLIQERDEAEEAIGQAYYLITGKSPEWSNHFGYAEALEEIDDAQRLLRQSLARPTVQEDAVQRAVEALSQCKEIFELYVTLHKQKGTDDGNLKAMANQAHADMVTEALNALRAPGRET